jgi:hypothetical protein
MPYGTQPTWDDIVARYKWNVSRLLTPWRWQELNPYVLAGEGDLLPKERTAWEDIGHSLENLWREWRRLK